MERLSPEKRNELLDKAIELYMDSAKVSDITDVAEYRAEMTVAEVLMRKYRVIRCIKLLQEYGLADRFEGLEFVDMLKPDYLAPLSRICNEESEDYAELYEEVINDCVEPLESFNEKFMGCCLKDTSWSVKFFTCMDDYEYADKELLEHMRGVVEFHWYAMEYHQMVPEDENNLPIRYERLDSLGFKPDGDECYYPTYNMVLQNSNISRMLRICKENKKYKEWEEYMELCKIRDFVLLDRSFIGLYERDMRKEDFIAIYYLCGEICVEKQEEVGTYLLCYEAVLYLLLADMLAVDFLEKYDANDERGAA